MKYKIYVKTGSIMLYTIWVTTGESPDKGANARLFIELWGSAGKSDEVFLGQPVDYLPGESLTDIFELDLPDLGDIHRICLRHDNTGSYPDWFIDKVHIFQENGEFWRFTFNQWMSEDRYPYQLTLCRESDMVEEEESERYSAAEPVWQS